MGKRPRRLHTAAPAAPVRMLSSVAPDELSMAAELLVQCADAGPGLVVLFATTSVDLGRLGRLLHEGGRELLAGAATGRAIGAPGFLEHGVTGFVLPASRFAVAEAVIEDPTHLGPGDAALLVRSLEQRIAAGPGAAFRHRFGMLLVDAESRCEEPLTAALGLALSGVPLAGGSSGDTYFSSQERPPATAMVLCGSRGLNRAAVLCLVATDAPVYAASHNNFRPGRRRVVITDADPRRRVIHEIDGRRALDAYTAACGLRGRSCDLGDFASHPLMIRIGGHYYPRGIQRICADGSLEFACAVEPGVVMTVAQPEDMCARLAQLFAEISATVGPTELVIGFECAARTAAMEREGLADVITDLMQRHRVVGFATLGEQFGTMHANNSFSCIAIGGPRSP